jgi:hypothetical protein
MNRRALLASLLTPAVGAAASVPAVAVLAPDDPTRPARDARGKAVCRVYREEAQGVWRQIRTDEVRAGDRIVCIGQDGDRLWKADAMTVAGLVAPQNGDAGGVMTDPAKDNNLLIEGFTP